MPERERPTSLLAAGRAALLARSLHPIGGRERIPVAVAWAIGVGCVLALAARFRYATDVTDETFSIAMPYRMVLGDKPFVDEQSLQQTAGMLLFPFLWLFVKVTGGTSGIVLFVRGVHLFYKAIAAACVYAAGRRVLEHRSSAIVVAFVPFAFVPHSIPNVGYNVLGMTLTTAGTFLSFAALARPSPRRDMLMAAGALQALAAFAYPPMVVGPLLAAVLVFACAPTARLSSFLSFAAGCALALALVSPTFAFGGIAGLERSLGASGVAASHAGEARVRVILRAFWGGAPGLYGYAAAALIGARLLRSRSTIVVVVTAVTLALVLSNRDEHHHLLAAIHLVMYVGVAAPLFLIASRIDGRVVRLFALVYPPSLACALAAGTMSTQHVSATALGLNASLVLFAMLGAHALERAGAERTHCLLPAAAIMLVLVGQCWDAVYRDAPIPHLTTKVKSGPFRGIWTTADRAALFGELEEIARAYDRPGGRVLYLHDMPGLYLFSRMRPSAESVWDVPWGGHDELLSYWRRHVTGKGIVVMIRGTGHAQDVEAVVARPERKIFESPHCVVYAEP